MTIQSLEGRPGARIQNSDPKMYTLSSGDYKVTGITTTKNRKRFALYCVALLVFKNQKYKGENIGIVAP